MRVQRWDIGTFKPIKTANGWLRADATLTRTGVFVYTQPDGTQRRELRVPEEVERDDSLLSLQLAPITNGHPSEMLTAENTKQFQVGTVGTDVRTDNGIIRATVQITDKTAVEAVDRGEKRELSCGYSCELEPVSGTWQGQRYDAIQRGIAYNHVALTPLGRAGRDIRIHMDAEDAAMQPNKPIEGARTMEATVRFDGVDYEVSKQAAQAFHVYKERMDAEIATMKEQTKTQTSKLDQVQAKLDDTVSKLDSITKERDEALKPERITQAVQARLEVERSAAKLLGAEKLDALTDQDIMIKAIKAVHPDVVLEGKSADYIRARFDAALEPAPRNDALANTRTVASQATTETRTDAASARQRMMQNDDKRWMSASEGA